MRAIAEAVLYARRLFKSAMKIFFRESSREPFSFYQEPIRQTETPTKEHPQDELRVEKAKKQKATRSATQMRPDSKTLSDLLDRVDDVFDTYKIPSISGTWLPKSDIRALKRMGVYVKDDWGIENSPVDQPVTIEKSVALPMMASAAMIPSRMERESRKESGKHDVCYPRFVYAIKQPRLPIGVEKISGIAYQFGMNVQLSEKQEEPDGPPHMFWMWAWIVIKPNGEIAVPHELRSVSSVIRHKRGVSNHGMRTSIITTKHRALPTMFTGEDFWNADKKNEYHHFLRLSFRQLILWWVRRKDNWSVGLRKGDDRVTFSVAPHHTAAYFADRDKTIKAADGTAKKIVHYVREHTRANGSVVKAHIRGISEFNWRGTRCFVTAPTFNGEIFTDASLMPVLVEPGYDKARFISNYGAAKKLADAEDLDGKRAAKC